jgi:hypothetical protein
MSIKKQDFYEGAALYQLLRTNAVERVAYAHPFFVLNDQTAVLLKYTTRNDSPWSFAFTPAELVELGHDNKPFNYFVGLVCGSDGIVTLSLRQIRKVIANDGKSARIGCYRKHDQQYEVRGPLGILDRKISRSNWVKILTDGELL